MAVVLGARDESSGRRMVNYLERASLHGGTVGTVPKERLPVPQTVYGGGSNGEYTGSFKIIDASHVVKDEESGEDMWKPAISIKASDKYQFDGENCFVFSADSSNRLSPDEGSCFIDVGKESAIKYINGVGNWFDDIDTNLREQEESRMYITPNVQDGAYDGRVIPVYICLRSNRSGLPEGYGTTIAARSFFLIGGEPPALTVAPIYSYVLLGYVDVSLDTKSLTVAQGFYGEICFFKGFYSNVLAKIVSGDSLNGYTAVTIPDGITIPVIIPGSFLGSCIPSGTVISIGRHLLNSYTIEIT